VTDLCAWHASCVCATCRQQTRHLAKRSRLLGPHAPACATIVLNSDEARTSSLGALSCVWILDSIGSVFWNVWCGGPVSSGCGRRGFMPREALRPEPLAVEIGIEHRLPCLTSLAVARIMAMNMAAAGRENARAGRLVLISVDIMHSPNFQCISRSNMYVERCHRCIRTGRPQAWPPLDTSSSFSVEFTLLKQRSYARSSIGARQSVVSALKPTHAKFQGAGWFCGRRLFRARCLAHRLPPIS